MSHQVEMSILDELRKETWLLYSLGIFIIILRFTKLKKGVSTPSHVHKNGLRNFYIDDFLIIYALFWYTILCIFNIKLLEVGDTADLSAYDTKLVDTYSTATVAAYVLSSKYIIVAEQHNREKMNENLAVKVVAVYVIISFVATQFAFFFMTCPTFRGNWEEKPPSNQCVTWETYDIFQAPWNMSSDIFIMMIPLPLILKSSLSIRRKIVYSFVFGMGIFVVVAAFLNKWYNVYDNYNPKGLFWYIREASVALYVANFLHVFPLILRGSRYLKTRSFAESIRTRSISMRSSVWSSSADKDTKYNMKLSEIPPLTLQDLEAARSHGLVIPSQPAAASSMISPRTSCDVSVPQKVVFKENITGKGVRNSGIVQFDENYSLQ